MKKVLLFFANGTEEVEALTPVDILRRAGADVTVCGVGGKTRTGAHGITVSADTVDSALPKENWDMVILPGGMPGTRYLDENPVVENTLKQVTENGGYLAAICAAPMILGKRGYLQGKEAICYPGFEVFLKGATLSEKKVCKDGHIMTAAGVGVALAFALTLVETLFGKEKREEIAGAVLAD